MTGALRGLMQRHGTSVYRYCRGLQQRDITNAPFTTIDRNVILYLAACPIGATRRALDEECATIEHELRLAGRHNFEFRSRWAVTIDEMMRHLNELAPNVIHISSHGSDKRRDGDAGPGIQLQDEHCQPRNVSASALSRMIGSAAPSTRLVVLNACFTKDVAESLCEVADCVVGMNSTIGAEATRSFAVGFYRALGYGRSVGNAVAQAIATLAAKDFWDWPICHTRNGVDANRIVLARSLALED